MTDSENLDEIKHFKIENINLGKENLVNSIEKINYKAEENISKINEVSKKANILNIEVISSSFEPKGLILKITPYGYEKSRRQANDGITYFGYIEHEDISNVR